jgi:hypothetical protein
MRDIRKLLVGMALLAGVMAILSACGGTPQVAGGGQGNALPTVRPTENIGSSAKSAAKDSYQATWDSYLRDSLAAANQTQDIKIALLQRYEKPSITAQNIGGIVKSTDLVQDNTKFNVSANNTASAMADFDVKMTFANGDTDTRHCKLQVAIELNPEDKLYYMLNPAPFAVQAICSR